MTYFSLDSYFGSNVEKDKVHNNRSMTHVLSYKFVLPTQLKNNSEFKEGFKKIFFATKSEFNKKSLDEINFDNVYKLQKEMDSLILKNIGSSDGFKLLTPFVKPEYSYILK